MKQSKLLIASLKRYLKHKGITYRELAKTLGQSESNVKRIFSQEAFSLKVLEEICEAVGIDFFELAKMSRSDKEDEAASFTRAQEEILAESPKLFAFLYLLLAGVSLEKITSRYEVSSAECTKFLLKLDKLRLIRLHAENRVQLLASKNIRWIAGGPLNSLYRDDIKKEFLLSEFSHFNERMRFLNAHLSKASLSSLSRRIDRLITEFVQLAEIDKATPNDETHHIWFMVAYRPWKFSVVSRYLKSGRG